MIDMAIYRNIQLSFWTDNKVLDEFTPEDKYFYLYLLTNPQTNLCGCYEVSFKSMSDDTGYTKETIVRLLKRFEEVHDIIRFNEATKEVLILKWYKYNWSKSEKTLTGVANAAKYIKCEAFKKFIIDAASNIKNGMPVSNFSDNKTDEVKNFSSYIEDVKECIDFNSEKAWDDTFAIYPKKSEAVIAKQRWMDKLTEVIPKNRKAVAILVYKATKKYLKNHKENNPDDVDFRYIPKYGDWLVKDCDYWIGLVEKEEMSNAG